MKNWLFLLLLVAGLAHAETHQQILDSYITQAGLASAARGEKLYRGIFKGGITANSCTTCHTQDAKAVGQHPKTHKVIDPLAPVVQRDRFTDSAKVEKWFKRNCQEVLSRQCSPQEKADFVAYMLSIK